MDNEYFKEIKQRLSKIADTYMDGDGFVIPENVAIGIIEDVENSYEKELWKSKHNPPLNFYGETNRLVIVRSKDIFENPKICIYNYADNKFIIDDTDVTESVKEWCDVPGYGYK